jgi:uncharacterized protein
MMSPIEIVAGLKVGTVESVSPTEIHVLLELDAPQTTALNTGIPSGFPRINSYVLVPNESGAVVGVVVWIGIERSSFPRRHGLKDFDLVDLPFPLRKMVVTPLGTLARDDSPTGVGFKLDRGVNFFPSVGDAVSLPSTSQLRAIIEPKDDDRRLRIGVSPLGLSTPIAVDPDKLFGRHLAVLGNTGSGKSCSTAGLIRWAIEHAEAERKRLGKDGPANARFLILDPNGEYAEAYSDLGDRVRVFRVPPTTDATQAMCLPAWMWNSHEWCTFASAAPGVQRPLLLQALRDMRAGCTVKQTAADRASRIIRSYKRQIQQAVSQGSEGYSGYVQARAMGQQLRNLALDAQRHSEETDGNLAKVLAEVAEVANNVAEGRYWSSNGKEGYNSFSETEVLSVLNSFVAVESELPVAAEGTQSEDAPIAFDVSQLPEQLEHLAANGHSQAAQFVAMLTMRIRMMLADSRKKPVYVPDRQPSLQEWLTDYVGADGASNGQITILDLSLVPSDVLSTTIAVLARFLFETLQRHRRINKQILPTVLVLEEAHSFIERGHGDGEGAPTPAQTCREAFEKIAREGRKFGLGLVLSSQRPSELSPTVLAQCNTFLLHRIVNDRDQELVKRLIPDKLGGLLADLPNLPTRQAILLGWASTIPVLVEMRELAKEHRPRSSDPDFWNVWTGQRPCEIDWDGLAKEWTG